MEDFGSGTPAGFDESSVLISAYSQYFTPNVNAASASDGASSFTIFSTYDYSIPEVFSDNSIATVVGSHA